MAKNPIPPEADRICTACPSLFPILVNLFLLYKTAALPHRIILPQPNALPFNCKDLTLLRKPAHFTSDVPPFWRRCYMLNGILLSPPQLCFTVW
jgi:hypothetical protein